MTNGRSCLFAAFQITTFRTDELSGFPSTSTVYTNTKIHTHIYTERVRWFLLKFTARLHIPADSNISTQPLWKYQILCLSVRTSHTNRHSQRKDCYSGNTAHLRTRIQRIESQVSCDIATCEPPTNYRRLDGTDIHKKPTKCTVARETPLNCF